LENDIDYPEFEDQCEDKQSNKIRLDTFEVLRTFDGYQDIVSTVQNFVGTKIKVAPCSAQVFLITQAYSIMEVKSVSITINDLQFVQGNETYSAFITTSTLQILFSWKFYVFLRHSWSNDVVLSFYWLE
jgi:hypothetical protein